MGLFDLFKSKSDKGKAGAGAGQGGDKNVARLGKVAGDKHAQMHAPILDVYSDYSFRGEGVNLTDPHDPYFQWVLGTLHISNVPSAIFFNSNFGGKDLDHRLWKGRFDPTTFDDQRLIYEEALEYNLRPVWLYPVWDPETGKMKHDAMLRYGFAMLRNREARWRAKEWLPIQDRRTASRGGERISVK